MKKSYIAIFLITLIIMSNLPLSDSTIPPTRAIQRVKAGNGTITALNYSYPLTLKAGANVTLTSHPGNHTIVITARGGGGGDSTTASNLGGLVQWFFNLVGTDLRYRGLSLGKGLTATQNSTVVKLSTNFQSNSITCSSGSFVSAISNTTDSTCTQVTPSSREWFVANWETNQVLTNIGTAYVDVYTADTQGGEGIRIDTTGMTKVTLQIAWTNIGSGTQVCEIRNISALNQVLIRLNALATGQNTNSSQSIPSTLLNTQNVYKPQCKSSVSTDDPTWWHASIFLKP